MLFRSDLTAAIKIFNEAMGRLASTWQAWEDRRQENIRNSREFVSDVSALMKRMNGKYRHCNECCVDPTEASGDFKLFDSEPAAHDALFVNFMHPPVQSREQFEYFMIAFYKVFYDLPRKKLEGMDKAGKLTGPLVLVNRAFKGDFPRIFTKLRNRAAHTRTNEAAAIEEVAGAIERLAGRRHIAPEDTVAWTGLQKTVIIRQSEVLDEIGRAFTGPDAIPGPGA